MIYRTDIDGLRALAVLAVVLYHCHVPGFGWGFAGVDVFFVISGYLISTLLWHETETYGRPRLARFWSRRVRRLLPASSFVVLVSAIASVAVLSPLRLKLVGAATAATTGYGSNMLFGWLATDYFRADTIQSPLLHTWSLAVEEQFYVIWPLIFLLPALAGLRRRGLLAVLALMCAASLLLSLVLTSRGTPWAFYGMPSRAWQFAAGGLLALSTLGRAPTKAPLTVGIAALLALALPFLLYHGAPYPGWRALLPTAATLLLLYGAPGTPAVHQALSSPPARWLGARSYGWYLWHWPPLVLLGDVAHQVPLLAQVGIGAVTLGLADLSYRWLENPVRRHPALQDRPARNFALAGVLAVIGFATAAGLIGWGMKREQDPDVAPWVVQTQASPVTQCNPLTTERGGRCWYGDPTAETVVLVVGDSHATHWVPALDAAGKTLGVAITLGTYRGCPALDIPLWNPAHERPCAKRRGHVEEFLGSRRPDAVILSQMHAYGDVGMAAAHGEELVTEWSAAMETFATRMKEKRLPFGVLQDVAYPTLRPEHCVTSTTDLASCDTPIDALGSMVRIHAAQAEGVARAGHGRVFDPTTELCDGSRCRVTVDDLLVYRDQHHLAVPYARSRTDDITAFLSDVLGR